MSKHNQNPQFYNKEYYLTNCGGYEQYKTGEFYELATYQYIAKIADGFAGKSVLDLGCGRGEMCFYALKEGASSVTGVDFSQDAVELCINLKNELEKEKNLKLNVNFMCQSALELSLNIKYDIIILADIVEHLYDDELTKLFHVVKSHLAKDGKVVIHTMPTREFILVGQYFKLLSYWLRGRPIRIDSFESQKAVTHVNLHSRSSLEKHLQIFSAKIWYDFSHHSKLRNLIRKTPFIRFFCSNLWAIAKH
jgi:cyclopropane fatty-acyl-phospholipid synthase-like methyltransferase